MGRAGQLGQLVPLAPVVRLEWRESRELLATMALPVLLVPGEFKVVLELEVFLVSLASLDHGVHQETREMKVREDLKVLLDQ